MCIEHSGPSSGIAISHANEFGFQSGLVFFLAD
jgi:hypothetical protein